ncbi:MAG: HEAT repeat domain-containing protein [Nitrospirae bacterium]|nr:HEAT repeat domain-containing protein [Nitrospirota bacterium]
MADEKKAAAVFQSKFNSLMKSDDVEVRLDAVRQLIKLKNRTLAIALLIKSLEDDNWRIRKTAVELLLAIKSNAVIKGLISTLKRENNANARNSALEALISLGHTVTGHLKKAYNTPNPDVRKFVIDIVGRTKDPKALPVLLKAIEDKDDNVRSSAIEYLCDFRDKSAVTSLIPIMKGVNTWLAYHAVDGLGKIGDARAVDALVSALHRKDLRKPVIKALGQIADPESLTKIAPFLKDGLKTVQEETIIAIKQFYERGISEDIIIKTINKIHGSEAVSLLAHHAKSEKTDVMIASTVLLGLLRDKSVLPALLEMAIEEEPSEIIIKTLVSISKASPDFLIPFFNSKDLYQRRVICGIAAKAASAAFQDHLISLLKDEDGHVRSSAAIALSTLDNPETVKHIKPLMFDRYEDVQEAALKALLRLEKWLDTDEITASLSDKNPVVRKSSAVLLGLIGAKKAIETLGAALRDSDVRVRTAVVDALSRIDTPESIKYLMPALSDESPEVRKSAAMAISMIDSEEVVEPLIFLLNDTNVFVRVAAAKGLGSTRNKKAVEPLINLLSDTSGFVKAAAIKELGNFKEKKVKEVLRRLLKDKDAEIRATAIESLSIFDGIFRDLIPLLKDNAWSVRKKAVDVLGKFFKSESEKYLKDTAELDEDYQVRETAERYLAI